jgi:hypothetical protein
MKSEAINELAAALAKAQAKITGAVKNAANPHFRSSYANLEAVWDAIREPLTSNGLSVVQTTAANTDTGALELVTLLLHTSGQYIEGRFPIVAVKQDPQAIGSATSYARRFALAAIVGVYQTDDEAETATTRGASVAISAEPKKAPAPKVAAPVKPANAFANFGGENGKF